MKILHLIFALPNAGKENLLVDIANEQSKANTVGVIIINNYIDVVVFEKLFSNIIKISIKRKIKSRSFSPFLHLYFQIIKFNPDVIHCHDIELIRLFPLKFIYHFFITVHSTGSYNECLKRYYKIFAISKSVKDYIININPILKDKIFIVYNGIDFSKLQIKKNFKIVKHLNIIQISRLNINQKGQDILIHALNILNRQRIIPFECHFVGIGTDYKKLNDLVNDYKLNDHIIFLGNKPREWIYSNLCYYDVLIQPSRSEGFGLTIIEALGAKVPVISSNIEGPNEILENGKWGIIFVSENILDLAEKIKNLYHDYSNIKNNIDLCYQYAKNQFTIQNTARSYIEMYK